MTVTMCSVVEETSFDNGALNPMQCSQLLPFLKYALVSAKELPEAGELAGRLCLLTTEDKMTVSFKPKVEEKVLKQVCAIFNRVICPPTNIPVASSGKKQSFLFKEGLGHVEVDFQQYGLQNTFTRALCVLYAYMPDALFDPTLKGEEAERFSQLRTQLEREIDTINNPPGRF